MKVEGVKQLLIVAIIAISVMAAACTTQQAPQPSQPNTTAASECTSDADCAIGGCSGQMCTTKERASGLITTCEYREEYGCYKLTTCGCITGKCSWKQTADFNNCLANPPAIK